MRRALGAWLWSVAAVACGSGSSGGFTNPGGDDGGTTPDGGGVTSEGGGAEGDAAPIEGGSPRAEGGASCPAPPNGAPAQAAAALGAMNGVRAAMGVPCAALVGTLDTAAADHCAYFAANQASASCVANPHVEVSGCSMYVAANFGDRDVAAGYTGAAVFEDMAFVDDGAAAVQMWIDSVWHRTPVLNPWILDVGYGGAAGCDTMDFGIGAGASTPATVTGTYPYPGQTGVPTSFDGNEGPTPPAPPSGFPSGYPITIFLMNGTVSAHTLTVDGSSTPIAHQWIAPGDPASNGLLLDDYVMYANTPLTPQTRYRVQITATPASFDWTFTTQ